MINMIRDKKIFKIIITLALFFFVFLGTEYLFVDMMCYVTNSNRVVMAQSYILGASVIGFLLFPIMNRNCKKSTRNIVVFTMALAVVINIFIVWQHSSYYSILFAGCFIYVLFGIVGNMVCYLFISILKDRDCLGKAVGLSYALGIFFQFLNNNLVKSDTTEAITLSVSFAFLTVFLIKTIEDNHILSMEEDAQETNGKKPDDEWVLKNPTIAGVLLILIVGFMSFIFATLDNVVTLEHAKGEINLGEWPRLLLAFSGLSSGFVFDQQKRRYMHVSMYCVTILSLICMIAIKMSGLLLIGLIIFYLSAGCFAVYFTTAFMDIALKMKSPDLWAGLGRAVNNFCAVLITIPSVSFSGLEKDMAIIITVLILFVCITITITFYMCQYKRVENKDVILKENRLDDEELFVAFSKEFMLTEKEMEVLRLLLTAEDNIQEIAEQLFISRAALYRHISSLNKKTITKSRIGILQFYYRWSSSK